MAQDQNNMNKRHKRREDMKVQRLAEQKRLKQGLVIAAVILVICGAVIWTIAKDVDSLTKPKQDEEQVQETVQPTGLPSTPAGEPTAPSENPHDPRHKPVTKIHIRAAGDLNVTNDVVDSGRVGQKYDYTRAFIDVQALLADADLTLLNFEGSICGEPYGSDTRSAPPELLTGLINAGVDMLQTANSYSIYNGLIGMTATLQSIKNSGLISVGAYATPSEYERSKGYTIVDVQGVKIAFVAFTKGVGGMGMPAGNEDCVNLLYEDYDSTYQKINTKKITKVLRSAAAEKPDITIALLHWGSEYNDTISESQLKIEELMMNEGVSVIIGTHPHTVQKISFDKSKNTLVAYSLGDFYGDASRAGTNYSIILDIEITKDEGAGTTKVTDYSYFPIYTLSQFEREEKNSVAKQVMRIGSAMDAREGNFVDRITGDAYRSMEYSLGRISDRVRGVDEELAKQKEMEENGLIKKKKKKKKETEPTGETGETTEATEETTEPLNDLDTSVTPQSTETQTQATEKK